MTSEPGKLQRREDDDDQQNGARNGSHLLPGCERRSLVGAS
jgi:hypothetical protein